MFNTTKIATSLVGIVGLRNPFNPDYAILDVENTSSRSGLFVTDNAYAKIEYLKDTQDYQAISNNNFNELLKRMQKKSIVNVCNQVFSNSNFIDRNVIYSKATNKVEAEILPNGFVGYRICVSDEKNIAFKISRVLLDFDGTGDFDLMLFNTSKKEPIQTKTVSIASNYQSLELNWEVDNSSDTYKGDYYIGYVSTGLTVSPFKRNYSNSSLVNVITNLKIEKICVPNHIGNELFNLNLVQSLDEYSGLNLDIVVYDDFTDLIIQNQSLFARSICLDFVISFLHSYLTSLRINANERDSAILYDKVMLELNGTTKESSIKVNGLKSLLLDEIGQLKEEMDRLKRGYFGNEIITITVE
jgi:hypothetical protein